MATPCYWITGASGLLGRELLRRIAAVEPEARIYALLRAPGGEAAARAAELGLRDLAPRLVPVGGDLMRLRLGLAPRDLDRLASDVTHVIHLGASVRFDQDLQRARQVNAFGTRQVLELGERMQRLERIVHVSTAFVAGDLPGALLEGPAEPARFRNHYERSKFEAEEAVQEAMASLPVTVVRPSIVGPALGGDAEAHFLLLLRLYLERGFRWVPGRRGSVVDLVPADAVAHGLHALARRPLADSRWYHLAAGPGASTLGALGRMCERAFAAKPLRFVSPPLFRAALRLTAWGRMRRSLERAAPFVPYLAVRTRIETTDTRRVLAEAGVGLPATVDTFAALLERLRKAEPLSADRAAPAEPRHAAGRRS